MSGLRSYRTIECPCLCRKRDSMSTSNDYDSTRTLWVRQRRNHPWSARCPRIWRYVTVCCCTSLCAAFRLIEVNSMLLWKISHRSVGDTDQPCGKGWSLQCPRVVREPECMDYICDRYSHIYSSRTTRGHWRNDRMQPPCTANRSA